jgi:hypothetical protein
MASLWAQALEEYGAGDEDMDSMRKLLEICGNLSGFVFARHLLPDELNQKLPDYVGNLLQLLQTDLFETLGRRPKSHLVCHLPQCFRIWTGHLVSTEAHEHCNKVSVCGVRLSIAAQTMSFLPQLVHPRDV